MDFILRCDPDYHLFVGSRNSIPNRVEGDSIVIGKSGTRSEEGLIFGKERMESRSWASYSGCGQEKYPHQHDTLPKVIFFSF